MRNPLLYQHQIEEILQKLKLLLPILKILSFSELNCTNIFCTEVGAISISIFFIAVIILVIRYLLNKRITFYLGLKKCLWKDALKSTYKMGVLLFISLFILDLFIHNVPDIAQQVGTSVTNPYVRIRSAIVYPILEEITFRGFLYQFLKDIFKKFLLNKTTIIVLAAIIQSFIWSLQHLQYHSLLVHLNIFIVGLFLAYIREKTQSIYPAMGYHGVLNTIANITSSIGF